MRSLSIAAATALCVFAVVPVHATKIGGTHGRNEIKQTCAASGGNYYSNLDGYGCFKENCDGKGGLCGVVCKNDGKCEGSTPTQITVKPGGPRASPRSFLRAN